MNDLDFNLQNIENNIGNFSSQKLCEMIVCNRYFNFNQKISILCMQELSTRRTNGEVYDFENYIEKSFEELPKLNFETPDIRGVLSQMIGKKSK